MPANIRNKARQSITRSSISTGLVADSAPSDPTSSIQPNSVAVRSRGNQITNTVIDDIRHTATPMPISIRPNSKPGMPLAMENTTAPAAATSNIVALTRRGP